MCVLLLAEDVDGDDDPDNGLAPGWEVAKDPDQELVVGSQIEVKVCYFLLLCVYVLYHSVAIDTRDRSHRPSISLLSFCVCSVQVLGPIRADNFSSITSVLASIW